MTVYVLFHSQIDGYAYNCFGTDPFHRDLIGIYDSREKAEQAAIEHKLSIDKEDGSNNGVIEEIKVQ